MCKLEDTLACAVANVLPESMLTGWVLSYHHGLIGELMRRLEALEDK